MNRRCDPASYILLALAVSNSLAQTQVDLRTQAKSIDFSTVITRPFQTGTNLPSRCTIGQTYFKTNEASGLNLYTCAPDNVWTRSGGRSAANYTASFLSQTSVVIRESSHQMASADLLVECYDNSAPPQRIEPDSLKIDNSSYDITITFLNAQSGRCVVDGGGGGGSGQLGGDLQGTSPAGTVTGIQGRAVAATAPEAGQALAWNTTASRWEPTTIGAANYGFAFSGQTVVTARGVDHQMRNSNLVVECYDAGNPPRKIEPDMVAIDNTTYDITVRFTQTQSGRCVVNGSGGGGGGGATQFGGDLQGSSSSATVTAIQNRPVAATAPQSGQALTWSTANGRWEPGTAGIANYGSVFSGQTVVTIRGADHQMMSPNLFVECYDNEDPPQRIEPNATTVNSTSYDVAISFASPQSGRCVVNGSGGGLSQPGMSSQLGDLTVTRSSDTVLTIGAGCTPTTPCNVRMGGTVYTFDSSASLMLAAGSGILFLYIDTSGALTAAHTMTMSRAVGVTERANTAGFPAAALPLYTWTATNGAWDLNGGRDKRSFMGKSVLTPGQGIAITEAGQSVISLDTALVPTYATATAILDFPALASGTCSSELSLALPGAAAGDSVAPGWPASLEPGLLGMMRVAGSNQVAVRLCNLSGATIDPASQTFRVTVVRSF